MTVVDVHVHWIPPKFRADVALLSAHDPAFGRRFGSLLAPSVDPATSTSELLRGMDAAGVDVAVLSVPPPAARLNSAGAAAGDAVKLNDDLLAVVDHHADRFLAAVCIPDTDADRACQEVSRCAEHPGVRAVAVQTDVAAPALDGDHFATCLEVVADRGLALFLHPGLEEMSAQFSDWNLHSALGAPFATTVAAARLVLSGLLDRLSGLRVVLPHLGGTLPYLFSRLEEQALPGAAKEPLSWYCRERFFYDSCSYHPPALRCAVDTAGASRLLLGSDFPFRGSFARAMRHLDEQLTPAEKLSVAVTNPAAVVGGPVGHQRRSAS